jgi:cytochrome c oxidase subunit II
MSLQDISRRAVPALSLVCGGCGGWQSALDPGGPQSARLSGLIWQFAIISVVIWGLVMLALAGALLRRRAAVEDRAAGRRPALVVGAAVAASALVIIGLTLASYFATGGLAAGATDPLVIRVRGHQWWWEAEYPGQPANREFTTANEIHIPIGRPIRVELEAEDVIHSFWAPNLAGKQDLIPGRDNAISFTVEKPGTYRQQCAEFCGLQHAHMAMLIIAEPPARFARWRAAQLADAAAPAGPEQARGRQVFEDKPCAACHTIRGTAAAGTIGPDLTHVAGRQYIASGMLPTTRGSLAAWIADPQTLKPGNAMPMVPLTAAELNAVAAYLDGLK